MPSINEYCGMLARQRHSFEAKGKLLWFPRTEMTMVPVHQHRGGWDCVVVVGDPAGVYKPGGYSLYVSDLEIETATELDARTATAF
jgi:hypothetical protein